MPVHKFIHKYPQPPSTPPVAVLWYPSEDVKYPAERDHTHKWKIFAQEDMSVQSHNVSSIELKFGVEMSFGVTIVSLTQQLKKVKLSIQNESVVETADDIVITIQNNSNNDITIRAGDALCYLTFISILNDIL
jgi:dUTPase